MSIFEGVVFAGGGCRCFWQAGFYHELSKAHPLAPTHVSAASAGAALCSVSTIGYEELALENFKKKASGNKKNIYWKGANFPRFPHEQLFREAITETIDEKALSKIQQGPKFFVPLTRVPDKTKHKKLLLLTGFASYLVERRIKESVHCFWPQKLGLQVEWQRADQSQNLSELSDLLLQTSCTPPFTAALQRNGKAVFDGGLTDNVPVAALPSLKSVLVLLTRPAKNTPRKQGITYVAPSTPISVKKWDYTDPQGLQEAFDLGKKDGMQFAREIHSST